MITVENIMQFLIVIGQFVTAYYTFYCFTILYVIGFITSFTVFTDTYYRIYSIHI